LSEFVHTERVRFGDLDAMRHLNNVVFLRYVETARIIYFRHLIPSHNPTDPEGQDFGFIVASVHIDYRAPVLFDEMVAVRCGVSHVGNASFRIPFTMAVEDRTVADGHCVLVSYDYVNHKPKTLSDAFRERLVAEMEE
jgi:acyl-CoA thioester hydrolase